MSPREFAAMLNGRQYNSEITREEESVARKVGLVVVYGASDDLAEINGAIHDQVGVWTGRTFRLARTGVASDYEHSHDCECPVVVAAGVEIEAVWCGEGPVADGFTWTYRTEIPHVTFQIFDDEERYCRGIVFRLNDLPEASS